MDDLKKLLDAVTEMRAAQKLEIDALPGNFKIWKKTRQQMTVAQLERQVDVLIAELCAVQNDKRDANQGDTES